MGAHFSCLALHGYGGAPADLGPVTRALQAKGVRVEAPCLPGHGLDEQAFARSRFQHWLAEAEEELHKLLPHGPCVLIGLSMGGSLALALAQRYALMGVVTIASPVFLYRFLPWQGASRLLPLVPWLRFIRPVFRVPSPPAESRDIAPHYGYEGFQALHPLSSFLQGLKSVRQGLHLVSAPILILHSPQDQTVPVTNAWSIASTVSSPLRRLELLSISEQVTTRHLLTTHMETKDRVRESIVNFVFQDGVAGAG